MSAPAASSRSASLGVMPTPSARFSPFATQKETPSSVRRARRRSSTARLPGAPTTSPTNRIFRGSADRQRGGGPDFERDVVAGVLRVAREGLPLDERQFEH